ncbi:pentapeptide repeat-containing protein [Streptomyces sp. Rer75]|uniref:pentapeptide repeat-containing protein n=1 Tax=Streptomyces sp. Rer75 TaxID=2750011 RepID=UPI00211E6EB5|nr:pentapeptide repeat-containing protein [Streptomyces sp. Rer75]
MKTEMKRQLTWGSGAFGVVFFVAALIWGPWIFEGDHVRDSGLAPSAGIIITGFRTMLVATAAGGIAGLGLYYTHRNHRHAEKLYEHSQEQFAHLREKDREQAELAREGQVTERYVEAIKLLGSEDMTERLGGIYSLERIMRDSEKDHDAVVKVLAAFVRRRAPLPSDEDAEEAGAASCPADDVQAVITVLGNRPVRSEEFRINLASTDLRGANLDGCHFKRAIFNGSRLDGIHAIRVDLENVWIQGASLCDAYLLEGNLDDASGYHTLFAGANLLQSTLRGATLLHSQFTDAGLTWANMDGANFSYSEMWRVNLYRSTSSAADFMGVDLWEADLNEADLRGSQLWFARNLTSGQLEHALIDDSTQLPEGLNEAAWVQEMLYVQGSPER